ISRGATEVIFEGFTSVYTTKKVEKGKGRSLSGLRTRKFSGFGHHMRTMRCAYFLRSSGRPETPLLPVHLPEVRPPSCWPGSIRHLLPVLGGPAIRASFRRFGISS